MSGEGQASGEVCEIVDVPAGFISDVWKHFGFHLLRNEKGEKSDRHKQYADSAGL